MGFLFWLIWCWALLIVCGCLGLLDYFGGFDLLFGVVFVSCIVSTCGLDCLLVLLIVVDLLMIDLGLTFCMINLMLLVSLFAFAWFWLVDLSFV